jgi:hypothetical protein
MSLQDWANVATIGQVVVVALSICFLWYQLNQQTKLARVANTQTQIALVSPFNLQMVQNNEMARLWTTAPADWTSLSAAQKQQYKSMLTWWFIFYENLFFQNEKGLIDPKIFAAWKNDIDVFVEEQLVEKYWAGLSKKYHQEFVDYLNARIKAKFSGQSRNATSLDPGPQQ